MKNEPHVIGDRVPNEHALIADLNRVAHGNEGGKLAVVIAPRAPRRFVRLFTIFQLIGRRLRQRRNHLALLELDDEQLKDIGVSRCQAYGDEYSRYHRGGTDDGRSDA